MKKALLVAMCFLAAGCATAPRPNPAQLQTADYGTYPDQWRAVATESISSEMTRPDKIIIRDMKEPAKVWISTPDGELLYGYGVCGLIANERGRLDPFFILVRDGKPQYKALGFQVVKREGGKTWTGKGPPSTIYQNCCPTLFK